MNKKIAVLVYGQYRMFDIAVKTWDFRFHLDCDFYFTTWKKTIYDSERYEHKKYHVDVTEDMFQKHIPDSKVCILNESDFFDETTITYKTPVKMIFHMKNGLKMINDSGKKYDYLMTIRPDIYLDIRCDLYTKNKKDRIYGLTTMFDVNGEYDANDMFFFGDFNVLSKVIRTMPNYITCPHKSIPTNIDNLGLFLEPLDMNATTVRPSTIDIPESERNFKSLFNDLKTWDY